MATLPNLRRCDSAAHAAGDGPRRDHHRPRGDDVAMRTAADIEDPHPGPNAREVDQRRGELGGCRDPRAGRMHQPARGRFPLLASRRQGYSRPTTAEAHEAVRSGAVMVRGTAVPTVATMVTDEEPIALAGLDKRFVSRSRLCRWTSPNRRPLLHQFRCDSFHSSGETKRGRLQRIPVALPVRRKRRAATAGSIDPGPRAKALAAAALL